VGHSCDNSGGRRRLSVEAVSVIPWQDILLLFLFVMSLLLLHMGITRAYGENVSDSQDEVF
jgi:hypothetical protein